MTEAPSLLMIVTNAASPPGLSVTVAANRISRRSAARPLSMTRPSMVISMFPPHSGIAILLPLSSGMSRGPPGNSAARPAAPPPSTTAFSCSRQRSTASARYFSLTVTTLSTYLRATSKECGPTHGTANPSPRVGMTVTATGLPAARARVYDAQYSGSTPIIMQLGRRVLMASAMPAISPAPPTGITTTSKSGTCSTISSPHVPAPAMMAGSS
mmetsp:Transcript_53453/g.78245  ORF Transcript_53453/g.78245 Transcript_53453/m.78245 type:complete len:213 (-) Transcript_53453:941-1579(-)